MKEEDGVLRRIVSVQLRHELRYEVKIMLRKMQDDPEWREMFQKFSCVERTAFERSFEEGMWDGLVEDESTIRFYRIFNTQLAKSDEAQKKNFVKATEFMMEKVDKWATMVAIMSHLDSDDESPDPWIDFIGDKFFLEETILKSLNKNFKHEKNWKNLNLNDFLRIADSLETFRIVLAIILVIISISL